MFHGACWGMSVFNKACGCIFCLHVGRWMAHAGLGVNSMKLLVFDGKC